MTVRKANMDLSSDHILEMKSLNNKDGAGVMWVEDGRVKVEKILSPTDEQLEELYNRHKNKNMAIHLRNQSVGSVNLGNVHPFMVTSMDSGAPVDIWMMHNGTINGLQVEVNMADSYNLATYFLRPLLTDNPELIKNKHFLHFLSAMIGTSKLVFLTSNEEFVVVNDALGQIHESGAWISTKSDINPKKVVSSVTTTYTPTANHVSSVAAIPIPGANIVPLPSKGAGFVGDNDGHKHFQFTEVHGATEYFQDALSVCPEWLQKMTKEDVPWLIDCTPAAQEFIQKLRPELLN